MTIALSPARRRSAITFIFITVLLDMVGFGLIMPVLPALISDVGTFSLSDAAIIGGTMFAAFSLAQFLFGPVMGNLSDAYGRRPLLLLAVAGLAFDYVFSALAPSIGWLFAGRIIAGVCGASYVIANAFIADITKADDRAKAFGLMGAAFGFGFVIGPAIGGLLGTFGPRVPFWVAAAISALNFAFGYFILPETLPPEKRRRFDWRRANPFGAFRVFSTYPTVLPLVVVLTLFFFVSSVYPAIWPFWGIARFGWSPAIIGATLAAFGVIAAVTQGVLSGPLVKRFGEHRVALVGLIFAAVAALGYGLAWNLPVVLILLVIHAPEGLVHPMLIALMSKAVPDDAQGELQGGIASASNLAMLVGTIFFTQVFSAFTAGGAPPPFAGYAFVVAAGLMALVLALYVMFDRRRTATA